MVKHHFTQTNPGTRRVVQLKSCSVVFGGRGMTRVRDTSSVGAEVQLSEPKVAVFPLHNNAKNPQLVEN